MKAFLDRVLDPPSYGWATPEGKLVVPPPGTLVRETLRRIDVFRSRKHWLAFTTWLFTLGLLPFAVVFVVRYLSWRHALFALAYSSFVMGSHATLWYHRFATHRAFAWRSAIARALARDLVVKVIPEEVYVVSHHVHHARTELPGDPYNPHGGALYCFLADANHQGIAKDLSPEDYARVVRLVAHTGLRPNAYEGYQRWGSVAHPARTYLHLLLNWSVQYALFFALGGHALACAAFTGALLWVVSIRTFNYDGHGQGKDRRRAFDYNRDDLSVNQLPSGIVAGEWHNNHHLYPRSARAGFLAWQLDLPYLAIRALHAVGLVRSYRDDAPAFRRRLLIEPSLPTRARLRAEGGHLRGGVGGEAPDDEE